MNPLSTLENTLKEILQVVKPLPEDWTTRFQIIQELKGAVESVESFRGATVEPFGSFVSDLFTKWGDLDVAIEFSNGSFFSHHGKKQKQRLLGDVMKALRQKGGWRRYQLVAHARVPILKVESNLQHISCDISIDNLKCQMKSKLLFWISKIDTRFRDMVLLVKEWAKAHNINNPRLGTFNSYSLTLLVVFHFQTCAPAILPPLKDIYPGNLIDDLKGSRDDTEREIAETCAANIRRFKSYSSRVKNRSSLSDLFFSFLRKFSDIYSRASDLGICTYTGQYQLIESNTRWLPKTYALFIEDPFEQPENSARAVNTRELMRISETFEMSCSMLNSANQSSHLATLVRPQTMGLIVKTPVRNPAYNFEHRQPTHPQRYRAGSSQSRTPISNHVPRQPTRPHSASQGDQLVWLHAELQPQAQTKPEHRQPTHPQRYRAGSSQSRTPTSNHGPRQPTRPQVPSASQGHELVCLHAELQPQFQTKPKSSSQLHRQFQAMKPNVPSQVQPRFETMKPRSHLNWSASKTPSLQTCEDQPQQMWRRRSTTNSENAETKI